MDRGKKGRMVPQGTLLPHPAFHRNVTANLLARIFPRP
jgi:hypothetical protein